MSALEPCTTCARHVRADAQVCPFCGAGHEARAQAVPWFLPASRAVLFTSGASLAMAAGADAPVYADTHEAVSMVPQYGAPSDYRPPDPPATPVPPPDAGARPPVDAGPERPRTPTTGRRRPGCDS